MNCYIPEEILYIIFTYTDIVQKTSISKKQRSYFLQKIRNDMFTHNSYIYEVYRNFITDFDVFLYNKNIEELKKYKDVILFRKNDILYPIYKIFTYKYMIYNLKDGESFKDVFTTRLKEIRKYEKTKCEKIYIKKISSKKRIQKRKELIDIFRYNGLVEVDTIFWIISQEYINNPDTIIKVEEVLSYIKDRLKNKTYKEICIINLEEVRKQEHKLVTCS